MALGGGSFGSRVLHIGHMETGPDGVKITRSQTSCPTCDHMAHIPDGLYDTASGVVRRGIDLLRTMDQADVGRLAEALRRRKAGEVDDQAVINAAPTAAKPWITQALRSQWAPCLVGILVSLFLYFLAKSDSEKATRQILQGQQQSQEQIARLEQQESQLQAVVRQLLEEQQATQQNPAVAQASPRRRPPQASKRYTPPKARGR